MTKKAQNTPKATLSGRKPVKDALAGKTEKIEKVLINNGARGEEIDTIRRLAASLNIPFQFVPEAKLNRLAPNINHQGVVATVAPIAFYDVDELLSKIAPTQDVVKQKKPTLLVLDRIEDPHNFGAILRSALAAGVAGVIIPTKHMAQLNDAALKTSAGTALKIPIARVKRLTDVLNQVKERGYWVVGADSGGKTAFGDYDWDKPVVIVMGSESKGIHPEVKAVCDTTLSIPMYGP
ncbi:MAG: 23S rRNA (guanosine(2251)-2'-O)-methyltransferase RlmB, partial [Rhodothermales bacterium]